MWPDGIWRTEVPERDADTQVRTRIAAKAKMLGTVPGRWGGHVNQFVK